MVPKSERKESMNSAIREKLSGLPDPLHFDFPHHHMKLLELIYLIAVVGAIFLLLIMGSMGFLAPAEANSMALLIFLLAVFLGILVVEKSSIVHKPKKSSS
jgi:hypothetical protein